MQRVNLGKPYEEYIKKLVKEGYNASASEVLRDALREKMKQPLIKEERKTLQELVHEGIEDVKAGRVRPYNKKLLKEAFKNVKENAKHGKPITAHVRP